MSDVVSTILSVYKADISDEKRKVKELKGEEQKRSKAQLDAIQKENSSIDGLIGTYGKWVGAIGTVTAGVLALQKGFEVYAKNARLAAANVNTDLDGLRRATRGLVDDQRLLEFSARAMNGTFALTQKETEAVLQGALALRKRMGIELPEALERVQEAVVEANTEGLEPLGLKIEATSGTMEAQQKILLALQAEYRKLGGDASVAGDEVSKAQISFTNSMNELQSNLGKIAVALTPVVDLVARLVGDIAKLVSSVTDLDARGIIKGAAKFSPVGPTVQALELAGVLGSETTSAFSDARQRILTDIQAQRVQAQRVENARPFFGPAVVPGDRPRSTGGGGARGSTFDLGASEALFRDQGLLEDIDRATFDAVRAENAARRQVSPSAVSADEIAVSIQATQEALTSLQAQADFVVSQHQQSVLESMFGRPEAFNAYAKGFEILSGASQSAFDAWITGSESAADAFKRFVGEAVRSIANQMFAESLKHGAFALGSLAFGNVPGAAQHGAAAAAFGAGAIAAGLVARELGAGQVRAGAAAGVGVPAVSGLGGGGGARDHRGQTTVVLFDEGFDRMPARAREAEARRRVRQAGITLEGDIVERR